MKRTLVFIIFIITLGALLFSADSNVTRIGGWGTGLYNDVFTKGHYAYIAAGWNGLDIINITSPSKPSTVGNLNLKDKANAVYVNGNYAYVACSGGLHIVDVSILTSPKVVGFYSLKQYYDPLHDRPASAVDIIADGNYAYLTVEFGLDDSCIIDILDVSNPAQAFQIGESIIWREFVSSLRKNGNYLFYCNEMEYNLEIYDVSNPFSPRQKNTINSVEKFAVNGNFAYTIYENDLKILNIADPTNPQQLGKCAIGYDVQNIFAAGNYLYLAEKTDTTQDKWQIQIIDVSNPKTPTVSGSCAFSGDLKELTVTGGTALAAAAERGLYIFDVGKPTSPRLLKRYDFSWAPIDIFVAGDRAYVADAYHELKIFDISAPTAPVLLGSYITPHYLMAVAVYGNYAYLATDANGVEIIDVTDPSKPVKAGVICDGCDIGTITINGNYAYYVSQLTFYILDLTNPLAPVVLGQLQIANPGTKIHINGNYAFLSGDYSYSYYDRDGVVVVDIANPSSPVFISNLYGETETFVGGVCVQGAYAYAANNSVELMSLDIFDFNPPSAPVRAGQYFMKDNIDDLDVNGNYVYLAASSGLYVMDVSHPGSPAAAGYLAGNVLDGAVMLQGKYIYLVTGSSGRFEILEFKPGKKPSQLRVNRNILRFHADQAKNLTAPQSLSIDTLSDNKLAWSLETLGAWWGHPKIDWIKCSQTSGTGSAEISVSIDPDKVAMMVQSEMFLFDGGYISISAPNALNSELNVYVSIIIDKNTDPNQPFGELATPPANAVVSGSVSVTGWALDNIGVAGVQIYREAGDQLVYIEDAAFVEGARPDVEIRYPGYPNYFKAGWGYMLLTQGLPGGDGPLILHAVATDIEGNRVTLGTTTITVANANSVKPFGAIDTPGQGETISGRGYINFGWALTPQPNTIPVDSSTIRVWIDGVMSGQPVYNQYRQDLAELFPGLNNSNGAAGYFIMDTTKYANGVHTIAWSVADDAGNADGIGSRYFQVGNESAGSNRETASWRFSDPVDLENVEIEKQPVRFKTGFDLNRDMETAFVSEDGISRITIRQLERVEVDLGVSPGGNISGYLLVGNTHRPLPIGSTLDAGNGIFYWQPGPGFVGTYDFIFVKEDKNRAAIVKRLVVNINTGY